MSISPPQGRHYAFEPLQDHSEYLARSFPSVRVFCVALGDVKGTAPFFRVIDRPTRSSLGLPRASVGRTEVLTVQTDLLDNLVPRDAPIRFIKIDVEGAEDKVFLGAKDTIRRNRPTIVFEHSRGSPGFSGASSVSIHHMLVEDCQLKLFLTTDWLRGKPPLARDAFVSLAEGTDSPYFFALD